ncbi:MAG TPA: tRNA pseudouridine(55) synthase TruB [Actinomycetota bacterium]|nr:tRNA pseudouridine(55) synthase TruB [Actinomycetota bacterium]
MTGFLLIDKPHGPTSHDIVDAVRRALGVKRVGHAGTLDPPATGLLVVAVGPATRLLRYVQPLPKTYEVTCALGVTTTTLDATGDVVEHRPVGVTPGEVRAAAASFVGEIEQVPPAVSAVKVAGERAYKRARRGEDVAIEPRKVTVHSFDILRTSSDAFDARIVCSSGTYVRSLVADLGARLGCGAHVVTLRRTAVGHLSVADAVEPERVAVGDVAPVEEVLEHMPRLEVDDATAKRLRDGQRVPTEAGAGEYVVVGPAGAVGVFVSCEGALRAETVLGN